MTSNATAILVEARELLVKGGWCQHAAFSGTGARCAIGAILSVSPKLLALEGHNANIGFRARDFLSKAVGNQVVGVWNDVQGRTLEEVLAAFDKAIELSKEKS